MPAALNTACSISRLSSGARLPPYPRPLRVPLRRAAPVLGVTACGMRGARLSREVCLVAALLRLRVWRPQPKDLRPLCCGRQTRFARLCCCRLLAWCAPSLRPVCVQRNEGLSVAALAAASPMVVRLVESYNYLGGRLCACVSRPSVSRGKPRVFSRPRCPCRASGARSRPHRLSRLCGLGCASKRHAAKAALPSVGTAVAPYGRGFLSAGALSCGCIGLPNFRQLRCSGPDCSINLETFRCTPSPCAQETVFDSSGRSAPSPTHHPKLNNHKKT